MEDSRLRSRRRAARALAERRRRGTAGASCDEESPTRERAKPPRRKKKDAIYEEDVIDGFAILSFKTYDDIEVFSGKTTNRVKVKSDAGEKKNKISLKSSKATSNGNITSNGVVSVKEDEEKEEIVIKKEHPEPVVVLTQSKPVVLIEKQDPGTSDESERKEKVPERVIKREADLDDRLSDASSRCSSGKGYICDSEDDDKASDSGSLLSSSPLPRKHDGVSKEHGESPPPPVVAASAAVQPVAVAQQPVVNGHHPRPVSPREEKPVMSAPVVPHRQQPSPPLPQVLPTPVISHPQPPIVHQPPPPQPQPTIHIGNGVAPKTERLSPVPPHSSPYCPPPSAAPTAVVSSVLSHHHSPHLPPNYPPHHSHHAAPGYPPHAIPHPAVSAHPHPTVSTLHQQQQQQALYHPPLYAPYSSTPYLPPTSQRVNRSPVGLKIVTTSCPVVTTTTTTSHRETVNSAIVGRSHSPRGHSPTREQESYSSNVSSLSRGSVGTPVSLSPYHPPPQQAPLAYNKPASVWVSSSSSSQVGTPGTRIGHPQFPAPMFPPAPPPVSVSTAPPPPPNPFTAESLFQSNQGDLLRRELDSRFLASQDRGPYIRTEMHHHQHQHTHVHQHTTTPIIPPPPPTLFNPPIFKEMPKAGGIDSPFYRQSIGFTGYPGYTPGLLHSTYGPSTPFAPPTHLPTFTPKQLTEPSKPKTVKSGKWNAMHVRIAWEIYHHQQKGGLQSSESKVSSLLKDPLRPPTHMFGPPFSPAHRPPPSSFDPPPPPTAFPPLSQSAAALGFQGGSLFGRYPPGTAPGPPGAFPSLPTFPHPAPPIHDPWAASRLSSRGVVPPGFPSGWAVKPEPSAEEKRERARREEKARARLVQVSSKARERSPLRAEGGTSKEEPAYLRQPLRPPHFPPPTAWEHHYRYDQLRFNPLMAAALREEEAHKLFYPGLRAKAPSPHQSKEESSQSR